ncbi:Bilin biosynthesis protein CpeY [Richelia intracellularis HH01]|uniref:Bilin biosynthesis protein CpeY n=1 Tax=Richelia intracellularis HH01 TaxID=1165094 RepID=M1WQY7_9NOST|nr:hypothetical protein [Richelia intracellularis]CCH66639.1 Bilin biosynthesis protein CpeY [Richelia intracellularis HH01]HAE06341.1 hypothetical protein [Richelia sp.]
MAQAGISAGEITFPDIQPYLEQGIFNYPNNLELVHKCDYIPSLTFAINQLYETDFGRCYLAAKTLLIFILMLSQKPLWRLIKRRLIMIMAFITMW